MDILSKLKPSIYNFRGNGSYNGLPLSTGLHYGLIAQEVEEVIPALVKNNVHTYRVLEEVAPAGPDTYLKEVTKQMEYKSLNYTELIPFLIKAVQEQQQEIELLKEKISKLR